MPVGADRDPLRGLDLDVAIRCVELSRLAYASPNEGLERAQQYGYESYQQLSGRAGRDRLIVVRLNGLRYVAFRGTDDLRDWATNLNAWPVTTPMGSVHRGYHEAAMALLPQLRDCLSQSAPDPVVFTGHSMGGALALLTALTLERDGLPVAGLYTFGQPRTGGAKFSHYVEGGFSAPYFRFVHGADALATWGYGSKALLGTPCYFDMRGRLGFGGRLREVPRLSVKFHRLAHYRYFLRLNRLRLQAISEDEEVTRIQ